MIGNLVNTVKTRLTVQNVMGKIIAQQKMWLKQKFQHLIPVPHAMKNVLRNLNQESMPLDGPR